MMSRMVLEEKNKIGKSNRGKIFKFEIQNIVNEWISLYEFSK